MPPHRLLSLLSAGLLALGTAVPAHAQSSVSSLSSLPPGSSASSLPTLFSDDLSSPGYPEIVPDTTIRLEVPMPDGPDRDVLISLPENYDPAQTYPVWLAYPGRFISPEHMSSDTGLQVASDAIVAYGRGEGGAWAGAPYALTDMAEDVAYSRAVVDRIAQDYPVDRDRVYAIGHSNGGGFALALACHAPDLVAGVAGVSGIYYNPGTPASGTCAGQPVPVMIIHSRNDGLSLLDGATAHGAPYVGAVAMVGVHAAINRCGGATTTRPVAPGVTAHIRQGCEADTEFVLSESDGHGWPHYSAFEAWNFLSRQSR